MLCSPIELFHLIFPKERMQYYAEMTMRYAAQKGGNLVVDGGDCKSEFNRFERIYRQVLLIINYQSGNFETTRSKSFTALSVKSSSSNSHYFNVCVEYQPFLSTDTDLINLIRFLWFLFSHTVSTLYTGIKQDSSSRGLLGSSKKYTIVFVYVIPYANKGVLPPLLHL
ncbi:hypothetical protein T05_12169 [Trichinella murrelli]|uniref:Uncharacterized protein n=1 Tax=Trichinella murrelli TaxID=144512 RepID=A0A0V0UFR9_9BILA|nr:hypothetical protein T05_12169 [Trichinella murrelli]